MATLSVRAQPTAAVSVANFIIFQIAWFLNVTMLAPWEWIAVFVGLGANVYWVSHFYGFHKTSREILWLIGIGLCGWCVERTFIHSGVLKLDASTSVPYWLINLWLVFATTFRFSLLPLIQRPFLLAFCAPLACLSYWGGVELNADAEFGMHPVTALLMIAAVWGVLLPLMAWIFRRYIL